VGQIVNEWFSQISRIQIHFRRVAVAEMTGFGT
jgi:hypothetical protein